MSGNKMRRTNYKKIIKYQYNSKKSNLEIGEIKVTSITVTHRYMTVHLLG